MQPGQRPRPSRGNCPAGQLAADAGRPQRRQLAGASTAGQHPGSPAGTTTRRRGINTTMMKDTNRSSCPAQPPGNPAAQLAGPAPVVNLYMTGCNINNGGQQIIGHSNTLAGGSAYGGADIYQIQADTIKAQAATIAAQHRTIERLLSIIEGRGPGA